MKPGDCTEAAAAGLSRRELLAWPAWPLPLFSRSVRSPRRNPRACRPGRATPRT